jgi:dienelactone hydrolase
VNDRVPVTFFPATGTTEARAPAVVLLHPLGQEELRTWHRFARELAARGIGAAVITLPYHMTRKPPGDRGGARFVSPEALEMAQASRQAAADVSATVTWLQSQPDVDLRRVGVVGISLGAFIAHLAMGLDERLSAGVAFLGGGDLPALRRRSLLFRFQRGVGVGEARPGAAAALRAADALTYADRNRPRRVLMVQAARDLIVPPHNARVLWEALGRPPIQWTDTNHTALRLVPKQILETTAAYLLSVWQDSPRPIPRVRPPVLKAGLISGLDARATPALQWQALSFGRRSDHMSLLHLNLGLSGRGPFAGLAATVTSTVDVGIAQRLNGQRPRPYLSLHFVF